MGMEMRMEPELTLRQEQRLEQRLEQNLSMVMAQRLLLVDGEKGLEEQKNVLEKIQKDLSRNVYSDVDNFHHRVMKRIKKDDRSEKVKELIRSLRKTIDDSKEQGKEVTLGTINEMVEFGISSAEARYLPSEVFESANSLSGKISDPLEQILHEGDKVLGAKSSPTEFYSGIVAIEKASGKTVTAQKGFDNLSRILSLHPGNANIASRMLHKTVRSGDTYSKEKIKVLWKFMDENCELAVPTNPAYSEVNPAKFLNSEELESFLSHSHIPLPILSEAARIGASQETLERLDNIARTKDMRKSRDSKRKFFTAIAKLRYSNEGKHVLKDVLKKSNGFRQTREILDKIERRFSMGVFNYDFNLPDGSAIINFLNRKVYDNPVLENLSEQELDLFEAKLNGSVPESYEFAYVPILKLGLIYQHTHPKKIELLTKMTRALINDRFEEFRYEDARSIECLGQGIDSWKQDSEKRRLIGNIDAIRPRYEAVKRLVNQMKQEFKENYASNVNTKTIEGLEKKREDLARDLSKHTIADDESERLVKELHETEAQLKYAKITTRLGELKLEEFPNTRKIISGCLDKHSHPDFRTSIEDLLTIVDSRSDVKTITVRDTDNPELTLNVGCTPIRSCQRWTEKTSYNDCLLAYVVDANKRLFQVVDESNQVRIRSITKVLEPRELEVPGIFVERRYANIHNKDLLKALIGGVVEKALNISQESGEPIAIGTKDKDYKAILKKIARGSDLEYQVGKWTVTFPESRNVEEYSDGFGGRLETGSKRSATSVGYIIINHEDNY